MTATKTGARSADTSNVKLSDVPGVADTALLKPDDLTPATSDDLEASGALMEPTIRDRIDVSHPAVDNEPRKNQPAVSNRIDFNDPTITDAEAVEQNLNDQA